MRDKFEEFYPYDEATLKAFIKSAHVVLDANVLLHIYRYSPEAADQLVSILLKLKGRLWMPHQVAAEFHANRAKVILDQAAAYGEILKSLDSIRVTAQKAFSSRDRHPFIRKQELLASIVDPVAKSVTEVEALQLEHDKRASAVMKVDKRWEALSELYENAVGDGYEAERLKDLYQEGERRFKAAIPPGFEDANKTGERKYGDFILWSQLLDHFESVKSDVVFVTDDQKADWWRVVSGKTLGAHPSLRREFRERTTARVHFYTSDEFVTHFAKHLGISLDQETRDEVERVSNASSDPHQFLGLTTEDNRGAAFAQLRADERMRERSRRLAFDETGSSWTQGERPEGFEAMRLEHALARIEYLQREADMLRDRLESPDSSPRKAVETVHAINLSLEEIAFAREQVASLLSAYMDRIHGPHPDPTLSISPQLVNRAMSEIARIPTIRRGSSSG